jgi:hypothetical protein
VLAWANTLLDANPNVHVIVAAHAYLNKAGNYDEWAANFKKTVLDPHPNVFLTLSGHYYPTQGNRTNVGGRDELLFNQQDAYEQLGANSARILSFNVTEGTIKVQTYNVELNQFFEDSNNRFTLNTSFRSHSAVGDFAWVLVLAGVVAVSVLGVGLVLVWRRGGVWFVEVCCWFGLV